MAPTAIVHVVGLLRRYRSDPKDSFASEAARGLGPAFEFALNVDPRFGTVGNGGIPPRYSGSRKGRRALPSRPSKSGLGGDNRQNGGRTPASSGMERLDVKAKLFPPHRVGGTWGRGSPYVSMDRRSAMQHSPSLAQYGYPGEELATNMYERFRRHGSSTVSLFKPALEGVVWSTEGHKSFVVSGLKTKRDLPRNIYEHNPGAGEPSERGSTVGDTTKYGRPLDRTPNLERFARTTVRATTLHTRYHELNLRILDENIRRPLKASSTVRVMEELRQKFLRKEPVMGRVLSYIDEKRAYAVGVGGIVARGIIRKPSMRAFKLVPGELGLWKILQVPDLDKLSNSIIILKQISVGRWYPKGFRRTRTQITQNLFPAPPAPGTPRAPLDKEGLPIQLSRKAKSIYAKLPVRASFDWPLKKIHPEVPRQVETIERSQKQKRIRSSGGRKRRVRKFKEALEELEKEEIDDEEDDDELPESVINSEYVPDKELKQIAKVVEMREGPRERAAYMKYMWARKILKKVDGNRVHLSRDVRGGINADIFDKATSISEVAIGNWQSKVALRKYLSALQHSQPAYNEVDNDEDDDEDSEQDYYEKNVSLKDGAGNDLIAGEEGATVDGMVKEDKWGAEVKCDEDDEDIDIGEDDKDRDIDEYEEDIDDDEDDEDIDNDEDEENMDNDEDVDDIGNNYEDEEDVDADEEEELWLDDFQGGGEEEDNDTEDDNAEHDYTEHDYEEDDYAEDECAEDDHTDDDDDPL